MVGDEGEYRVAHHQGAPQVVGQAGDLRVDLVDQPVVGGARAAHVPGLELVHLGLRQRPARAGHEWTGRADVAGGIPDHGHRQVRVAVVVVEEVRRRVPGRVRLAEGDVQEERMVAAMRPDVVLHHPDRLGGGPGGDVQLRRQHAGAPVVAVVGHARAEQAEVSPTRLGEHGQVVVAVAGAQKAALLVRAQQVEAVAGILRIDMALADAVGPVAVALEDPAQGVGLRPRLQVVEPGHAVRHRPLPAEQRAPRAHAGRQLGDRAREVVAGGGHRVDARRMDHRIAGDAEHVAAPLVGRDQDQVGACWRIAHPSFGSSSGWSGGSV